MLCFARINQDSRKAIVIVTHDPIVAGVCRKIFFLTDGIVRETCKKGDNQSRSGFMERIRGQMLCLIGLNEENSKK